MERLKSNHQSEKKDSKKKLDFIVGFTKILKREQQKMVDERFMSCSNNLSLNIS